jgi:hypothetical protein
VHDISWQAIHDTHSFAYLTHILKQLCTLLLEEATLIAQPPIENKYISHLVAEVHVGAIPEGVRLFIDIILKRRKIYFKVYQAHFLPFLIQRSVSL